MQELEAIVGQKHIKDNIKQLLMHQKLPHSLLFYGEDGLGKMAMAKAVASILVQRPVFTAEQEYAPIQVDRGDVFLIEPEKKTTGLKIGQWQDLLHEYLSKASDSIRVVIIEGLETARSDFMNALLKSIEEPPRNVYFILITNKRNRVLPTIISRCMLVPFLPASVEEIKDALERKGYTEQVDMVSGLCQGNWAQAQAMMDGSVGEEMQEALAIIEQCIAKEGAFYPIILRVHTYDKERLVNVMKHMRLIGRDMEALRYGAQEDTLYCPHMKRKISALLPEWHSRSIEKMMQETLRAEEALRLNVRPILVIDGLIIALRKAVKE